MSILGFGKSRMVTPADALPGRATPLLPQPAPHAVLGTSLTGPWPEGTEVIHLAMGCFWGAEEIFWRLPGIVSTSVGYLGGVTPNPTYEEVCTGRTGHAEAVMVAYDPTMITTYDILKAFWESHDPTQGYRQGNDTGTQYRSAAYYSTDEQRALIERTRDAYGPLIARPRLPGHHHARSDRRATSSTTWPRTTTSSTSTRTRTATAATPTPGWPCRPSASRRGEGAMT